MLLLVLQTFHTLRPIDKYAAHAYLGVPIREFGRFPNQV